MTTPIYRKENLAQILELSRNLSKNSVFAPAIYPLLALTQEGFDKLKTLPLDVNRKYEVGATLLHSAARVGNIECIQWLFKR